MELNGMNECLLLVAVKINYSFVMNASNWENQYLSFDCLYTVPNEYIEYALRH